VEIKQAHIEPITSIALHPFLGSEIPEGLHPEEHTLYFSDGRLYYSLAGNVPWPLVEDYSILKVHRL